MTAKEKQGFGLYFLFAFGMAWLCQVGGCIALLQQNNAVLYQLALIVTMFCPLLAVLLVQKAFLRQPTGIGWKVQGKRRFWLAAWFGPAVLTLLGAVLYFAVFPSRGSKIRKGVSFPIGSDEKRNGKTKYGIGKSADAGTRSKRTGNLF